MAALELERCYYCNKLFCCEDCCVNHMKDKHPEREYPQCPICRYEPLVIRNFQDESLLCHVLFNHMPLHCRTCGELFNNIEDLKGIGKCKSHPLIIIESPTFTELIKSTLSINTPSPLNKTPYEISLINRKGMSIGGINNFDNFTSPPELTRSTSTPVHVNVMKKNFNLHDKKMHKIPNIILTTPSFSINNDISSVKSNYNLSDNESIYCSLRSSIKSNLSNSTPLKSILSGKSISNDINQQDNSNNKKLEVMEEIDENEIHMKVNETHVTENVTPSVNKSILKHRDLKDCGKKVRFIDELKIKTDDKLDVSEVEEYFEARQSLGDMSAIIPDDLNVDKSSNDKFNKKNCKNVKMTIDNNENIAMSAKDDGGLKSQSTSRVVMMVLVEQTRTSNDQSVDLTPIIDSSLKKLKSVLLKDNLASLKNDTDKIHEKCSIVSIDSCTYVSSVECFKAPDVEFISHNNPSTPPNVNFSGSGFFSAIASAVKNALRNLSGMGSAKQSITDAVATSSTDISQSSSNIYPNTLKKSSGIIGKTMLNTSNRPNKRLHEEVDSNSFDLPLGVASDVSRDEYDNENDICSPLQKRPCGWYREIRGREPIARMKNSFSSPRGISLEKQCFQQGSLTVRNTVLPLPSRAHQSTQTDNIIFHT